MKFPNGTVIKRVRLLIKLAVVRLGVKMVLKFDNTTV